MLMIIGDRWTPLTLAVENALTPYEHPSLSRHMLSHCLHEDLRINIMIGVAVGCYNTIEIEWIQPELVGQQKGSGARVNMHL